MGLLNKIFGGKEKHSGPPSQPATSQFQESEQTEQYGSKNAPRRELVQVVLRDTMRKHGIPSDWIEIRILTAVNRRQVTGMHVQLIVKQGHDDLLTYVYAFQESFQREIEKFEPRAEEWLMSIAWQFQGKGTEGRVMPEPATWTGNAAAVAAAPPGVIDKDAPEEELHDDVEADLKALFAIRDAVLNEKDGEEPRDFQPTQPGFQDSDKPR
ncbi:hypothetical protein [Ramlibacter albus]|uniref:Uncharacterized protein n=1 Tax=Ramlibacter albus TaxID=2079448 RepID=A0A923S1D9_9BURK|nr:hypothetical protein [Ramlibacter albus]MBC5764181.1 hypothetical protein [Ramlibacter albus]